MSTKSKDRRKARRAAARLRLENLLVFTRHLERIDKCILKRPCSYFDYYMRLPNENIPK